MLRSRRLPLDYFAQAQQTVSQSGLTQKRPTFEALSKCTRQEPPKAVFIGLGLCTQAKLTEAIPLDVLGMLFPAERIRQAIRGRSVIVQIADIHAATNGFPSEQVEERAAALVQFLRHAKSLFGMERMKIVLASTLHEEPGYQRVLSQVRSVAPSNEAEYFIREVADIEYLNTVCGGIVKLGWTINQSVKNSRRFDELAFDKRFQEWRGCHVQFVYVKPGRTLDDDRPSTSPYVTTNRARRICLAPDEDVASKMHKAEASTSSATLAGLQKHLRAVTRAYGELVERVEGNPVSKAQHIINRFRRAMGC